jgi:hypothetical protein
MDNDTSVPFTAAALVVGAIAMLFVLGFAFRGHVHF